ncbi:MAG: putative glycosyltransferase [Candidatus Acidoferrum typicum]|nr:putative glycosyltransferase [Candidatus Acidoferrum typicum]
MPVAAKTVVKGKPAVSAIIVNWNGAHHLRICLPSLRAQSFTSLEIIVVDNGSKDESAELAAQFQARWLPLGTNVGLAPALNRGAAIAAGDYLLFINNDMRFDPGFVAALVEPLAKNEEMFATDGMQFNWDGSERAHLATRLMNKRPGSHSSTELVPGLYFYPNEVNRETQVYMGSAACILVRRRLFEKLHGFDDRLPLGYEDVEVCWRAWLHGWKTVYVPTAICWHHIGSSGRSEEGMRMNFRGILRGRLLLATKLLPLRYAVRTWLVSTAGLAKDVSRLRWSFAKDRIKTLVSTAGLMPQLLRERKELFGNAASSPEKHLDFLLKLTDDAVRF